MMGIHKRGNESDMPVGPRIKKGPEQQTQASRRWHLTQLNRWASLEQVPSRIVVGPALDGVASLAFLGPKAVGAFNGRIQCFPSLPRFQCQLDSIAGEVCLDRPRKPIQPLPCPCHVGNVQRSQGEELLQGFHRIRWRIEIRPEIENPCSRGKREKEPNPTSVLVLDGVTP